MLRDMYCYEPQRRAVMLMLEPLVRNSVLPRSATVAASVHPVHDRMQLQGLDNLTWVEVRGHANTVPQDIHDTLRIYGATVIILDDSMRRDRYNRKQR